MANKRLRKKAILSSITRALEPNSFQRNPFLPNLLNQPDLLIIPRPGRLVALHVYDFSERITWRLVLGAIEDLFELKTTLGADVRAAAIIVRETGEAELLDANPTAADMLRLVRNMFDLSEWVTGGDALEAGLFIRQLLTVRPRTTLADLWRAESKYQEAALQRHYHESDLAPLVAIDNKPSRRRKERMAEEVFEPIQALNPFPVERPFRVSGASSGLGRSRRDYSFQFDALVQTQFPALVEFLEGDRYGMRDKLRYLLAKGRLIRYSFDAGHVFPRTPNFRPVLIVDGNVAGPDHDPFRYVRLLISVGWRIARSDERERIPWLLEHADI
jgi:hypothetical protein